MSAPRPDLADFHQKVLMDEMMEVVGVDVLQAVDVDGGKSYLEARANCRKCSCEQACRSWLAEHSHGAPQDFCTNADFFRTLKAGES